MSRENVEIVARAIVAFNHRDVPVMFDLHARDVEWDDSSRLVDAAVYHGHEGLVRFVRNLDEAWEGFQVEPEGFYDAGDRVVAFLRASARGRGSGLRVDARIARTFTLKDGRITATRYYGDRDEALEAVGLRS